MQVKGWIKDWLYLLYITIFLDVDKQMHQKTLKRGTLNVLIQQRIMKLNKLKYKVLHLNGAIPSTKAGWGMD